MESAGAKILEPVMKVEVSGPEEYAPLPPGAAAACVRRVTRDCTDTKVFWWPASTAARA